MSHSTHTTGILAGALALCAASFHSQAAIENSVTLQPTVAHASDNGSVILAAQRGGGGADRAGGGGARTGGGAREAQGNRAGGGAINRQSTTSNRQVRSTASDNINHSRQTNVNANRNFNASNTNVNRDVDVNVHRDYYDGWDDRWHPVAAAAAVTATAMAVGAIVNSVPPSCSTVVVNGVGYSQCGSTWYQPQYAGTTVQYVVVSPPR